MNAVMHDVDRQGRSSTPAFTRLLDWLDNGHDTRGARYREMRRRLIDYFDRRGRPSPDSLADETLGRISRMLEETSIPVTPPARYCYVVARFVLLEDIRRAKRSGRFDAVHDIPQPAVASPHADDRAASSLECVGRGLDRLSAADRALVIEYYRDGRGQQTDCRHAMAARLGITPHALGIRAWRLRASLERDDSSENL